MAAVTIQLLDGFQASVEGVAVPPRAWRLKKARELVKILALAPGRRLHREQAMDALWREHAPSAAANNLYQAVHAARRVLGPEAIVVRDEMLSLADDVVVDVDLFERAADEAERLRTTAAVRAALDLYPGELLPENRYDDWAEEPRSRLGERYETLSAEFEGLGREQPVGRLPADASSFVGRSRELHELEILVARTRLLTLTGVGGTGKTRLGLELARRIAPEYTDGAVLVELAPVAEPATVPVAVAATLDLRALPGQELLDALRDFLAQRSLLLVLDNCEHVIGASAELVDAVLRAAPGVTVLATSREPLRVPGETVFRVPSLAIPDPELRLSPDELLRYESVRLFAERAARALPGFEIDERNAADAARICFRLDGLPLALELAAGRLGALDPAAIAERLDDRFRLLQGGNRAAPTRQQTLLATLQWSHDLLDDAERVLFRRLAVFVGGFDLEAAEAVCADDALESAAVADLLARLVEKSLVSAGDVGGRRRYDLLDSVRVYAHERLLEASEERVFARRHAAWATELAEREGRSTRLDVEAGNLRAALSMLLAENPQQALRLCVAVWPFWLRRIDLAEAQRRFAVALEAAPERSQLRVEALLAAAAFDFRGGTLESAATRAAEALAIASELGDVRSEVRARQCLAEVSIASDEARDAEVRIEQALELARRERFEVAEALCVYTDGVARWGLGDLEAADARLAESLALLRATRADEEVSSPLNIADMRVTVGDRGALGIVFEETLQPFVDVSAREAAGYVLANRASIARLRGDEARAEALLNESEALFRALEDQRGEATVLVRRGYLELAHGSMETARELLERALEIRTALNDRRGIGLVMSGLGMVDTFTGDYERAESHLAAARELFRRAGDRWGLASSLWRTADLRRAQGLLDDAWAALEEARDLLVVTKRTRWLAHADAALGELAEERGESELAETLYEAAYRFYDQANDREGRSVIEERLRLLAKKAQSSRKDAGDRTSVKRSTKGRTR